MDPTATKPPVPAFRPTPVDKSARHFTQRLREYKEAGYVIDDVKPYFDDGDSFGAVVQMKHPSFDAKPEDRLFISYALNCWIHSAVGLEHELEEPARRTRSRIGA